jgi:hypothetical protein
MEMNGGSNMSSAKEGHDYLMDTGVVACPGHKRAGRMSESSLFETRAREIGAIG